MYPSILEIDQNYCFFSVFDLESFESSLMIDNLRQKAPTYVQYHLLCSTINCIYSPTLKAKRYETQVQTHQEVVDMFYTLKLTSNFFIYRSEKVDHEANEIIEQTEEPFEESKSTKKHHSSSGSSSKSSRTNNDNLSG